MNDRTDVQRVIVAFLIIIVALGCIAFVTSLTISGGFLPGLGTALAIAALGITCLLCYPLVFAYWMVSGGTIGMRDLLILHSVVSAGFVIWYLVLVFG